MNAVSNHVSFALQFLRIVVALILAGYALTEGMQGVASEKWPTVKGKVTTSTIKKVHTKNGQRDEADIKYQYFVNGKSLTSDRIQFGGVVLRNQNELLDFYKSNKAVEIHYKPGDPSVACLETGFNGMCVWSCLAGALLFTFLAFTEDGRSKSSITSRNPAVSTNSKLRQAKADSGKLKPLLPILGLAALAMCIKYGVESINFGPIPSNVAGIAIIFGGGLMFVIFFSSLTPAVAMLMRARQLKLAEMVAKLNSLIYSGLGPQSYELALAYGLQGEIAQEQLNYPKALEFSKKALAVLAGRPNLETNPEGFGEKTDKMLKEHMANYEKSNASVSAICHESLGCILYDMGMYAEAMSHAEKSTRMAKDSLRGASGFNADGAKLALCSALALKGRVELATGNLEDAKSDLEESIRLRKELPQQYEERLATTMADLARTYSMQDETRKAERIIAEGMNIVATSRAPAHQLANAKLQSALAEVKTRTGHFAESEQLLNCSLSTREKLLVPGHPEIAKTFLALANLREAQGKNRDANSHRQTANQMLAKCFGATS